MYNNYYKICMLGFHDKCSPNGDIENLMTSLESTLNFPKKLKTYLVFSKVYNKNNISFSPYKILNIIHFMIQNFDNLLIWHKIRLK